MANNKIRNVLHLIDTDFVSGPGKTIYNSWKFIDQNKYKIYVAVFGKKHNSYYNFLQEKKVPSFLISERLRNFPYSFSYPYIIYQIRKLVSALKIDILHTHHRKADFLGYLSCLLSVTKVITTHHGFIENKGKEILTNKLGRWASGKMDAVIAVSSKMSDILAQYGISSEKIITIPNSIVIEDYINHNKSDRVIYLHNIKDKYPIIGSIGRLSPEKGQAVLCEAFLKVLEYFPKACLLLIGDGPDYNTLKSDYSEYSDNIIFTGFRCNIKDYISILDLHVLPSYTEGLPNVVLETSLMNVPNIATSVGGTPECLIDGKTGIIVETGNSEQITDAMIKIFRNPELKRKFQQNGISFVCSKFDFRNRMNKIITLYDHIL